MLLNSLLGFVIKLQIDQGIEINVCQFSLYVAGFRVMCTKLTCCASPIKPDGHPDGFHSVYWTLKQALWLVCHIEICYSSDLNSLRPQLDYVFVLKQQICCAT